MTAIRVELELADGQFTTRLLHAGESIKQFQANVARTSPALRAMSKAGLDVVRNVELADRTSKGFLATLRDVSVVAGMASIAVHKISGVSKTWAGEIVKINADLEKLTFQMRAMSRAADPITDAATQVEWLRLKAQEVPFALDALTNSFVKLRATGTDPLDGSMQAIIDGIAAIGGTDEQLKRVVLGISQMSGKGVIQMEEMRQQLAESMPRAMELMARSMNVSMAELIKAISTGRLAAKPALQAFYQELDRVFGGRAKTMMNTFSGLIQQARSRIQILATSSALKNNFFESAIKDQIRDLNEFLASSQAQIWANDLGNAMAGAVRGIRSVVDTFVQFRREIVNVGTALAAVFGGMLISRGVASLVSSFSAMTNSVRALSMGMGEATAKWRVYNMVANAGAPAMVQFKAAAGATASSLGTLLRIGGAIAPWAIGTGLTIYSLGEAFGVFRNKVADAYEELVKFGAESRAQAASISDNMLTQLEERSAAIKNAIRLGTSKNWTEELKSIEEQIAKIKSRRQSLIDEAGGREDQKSIQALQRKIDQRTEIMQGAHDREMSAIQDRFDKEAELESKAGGNMLRVQAERERALMEERIRYADERVKALDEMLTWETYRLKNAEKEKIETHTRTVNYLHRMIAEEKNARSQLKQSSLTMIADVANPQKAFESGQKYLQNMREEIAKLRAEISETNPELAKLEEMLTNKEFGELGADEVAKLADNLRRASVEMERLRKIRDGEKKAAADLQRIEEDLLKRRMDLIEKQTGKTLTEGERFKLRMANGFYEGLGPAEDIRKMLEKMSQGFDLNGSKANQLGSVLRDNTFGSQSANAVQTLNDKLRETAGILDQIGAGLNGVNFGNAFSPGLFGTGANFTPNVAALTGTMKDKMSTVMEMVIKEGFSPKVAAAVVGNWVKESALNPSAVGDNGTSFGFAQWHKERWAALKQFSGSMGMRADNPQAQVKFFAHEMAKNYPHLAGKMDMARSVEEAAAMFMREFERPHPKYADLQGRQQAAVNAYALAGKTQAPVTPAQAPAASVPVYNANAEAALQKAVSERLVATQRFEKAADDLSKRENALIKDEQKQSRADYLKELAEEAKNVRSEVDGANTHFNRLKSTIQSGKLGPKDVDHQSYRELVAAAKELDRVEADIAQKKEAKSRIDSSQETMARRQVELARRVEEAHSRMVDPNEIKTSSAFRALRQDLEQYLADVERVYGRESEQFRQAQMMKQNMLRQHRNAETVEKAAQWQAEANQMQRSLLSEGQQRQISINEQIAQIQAYVAQFQGSEEQRVQIVAAAEAKIAALRASSAGPMTQMMNQWADLQGNLQQAASGWMNSLADGLTNLVMGTGDLRSVIQGITRDLINMLLKYTMSQMFGGGKSGAMPGKGAMAGKGAMPGVGKMAAGKFGMFHTGGIVGGPSMMTRVDPSVFRYAPKFHTGGVVGGRRLSAGEVPIIAKKGEGVFTPEQMSAMGGFSQNMQVNAPITVNGSAGTPEQNDDLAKRMAKELEGAMRNVAADEMRKASRPGNFANSRSR